MQSNQEKENQKPDIGFNDKQQSSKYKDLERTKKGDKTKTNQKFDDNVNKEPCLRYIAFRRTKEGDEIFVDAITGFSQVVKHCDGLNHNTYSDEFIRIMTYDAYKEFIEN